MGRPVIHFWCTAPFIRLLIPFAAGIALQWYAQLPVVILYWAIAISILPVISFFFFSFYQRYHLSFINGIFITLLFVALGALLTWHTYICHSQKWFGHSYNANSDATSSLIITISEPLVEKEKTFKALANVTYLSNNGKWMSVKGKLVVYFKKDSTQKINSLDYGSQVIFHKRLQEIKNSGNPGAFDYKRYSIFNGITHQVYLQENEFELLPAKNREKRMLFIFWLREKITGILQKNISSQKELGLAEALLIGYKDDLDKTLVQSYSNTGVVHIIAISGLHLGLIYWLLVALFKPLKKKKGSALISSLCIIAGLWLFSLLAGAQPSVLRSALMLTCIVIGENLQRKSSIYNTLALSAFLLLCYNPFWLWDVGFQLSYAAVLSIVVFMKPVYNLFYFPNRLIDTVWKLNAVTLAAQILTIPLCLFYFHQFPNYFLFTNLIAVPLSSVILVGEIFICIIAFIPVVSSIAGTILTWLIWCMNTYIEKLEALPFSRWMGFQLTIVQVFLLFAFITAVSYWLMERAGKGLIIALVALLGFTIIRSYSFIQASRQEQLIIYNTPKRTAIDLVDGRGGFFIGDSSLFIDGYERNFHLTPSRITGRYIPSFLPGRNRFITWHDKHILLLDSTISFHSSSEKQAIDLLVLSKNPRIYIKDLNASLNIKQIVADGSVPAWKARYWKKDCDSLHIPWHDVSINGAFAMKLR